MASIYTKTTRKRGRGGTAEERARSRRAFRAWDTRRENEAFERRSAAAKKAVATRRRNAR
jgi:hypothetical protein